MEDDELSTEELVLCLEEELRKHKENKPSSDSPESGLNTPGLALSGGEGLTGGASAGTFVDTDVVGDPGEYGQTDMSSDMKTIPP